MINNLYRAENYWKTDFYRTFSLMQIDQIKRKCLHQKRVQLARDWLGAPITWLPIRSRLLGSCTDSLFRKTMKTLYSAEK